MKYLKSQIGIIQGRLTHCPPDILQCFPKNWKGEFAKCAEIGINYIELLIEEDYNAENPIWTESERYKLRQAADEQGILFYSICLDSAISTGIHDTNREELENLFIAVSDLKIKKIVVPLMGQSLLTLQSFDRICDALQRYSLIASKYNTDLTIESLAEPDLLIKLFSRLECNIGLTFDTGNRINLSKDICSEINKLWKFIDHIHIKDKDQAANNVPLGNGIVPFSKIFKILLQQDYSGALTLETCRGQDPIRTAKNNIDFLRSFGIYSLSQSVL